MLIGIQVKSTEIINSGYIKKYRDHHLRIQAKSTVVGKKQKKGKEASTSEYR
jgi:hypothetical protein